ncbi:MAG: hypothetical protein PHO15_00715 [Eubacteriales bacterium]|nr:hypothetical protein [Eubacteriales bacterium]
MEIDLTEIAIAVIGLVLSAVVIPLIKAAFTWLKGKTQNEALISAISEAETVAGNVVAGLQAAVVDGLKEKSADGKLSENDAKEVASTAVSMFLSDLSSKSLAVLEQNADDLTAYIGNMIEAKLAALKK